MTKLLFRTLPNQYPAGSAYAHFPFLVPARFEGKMAVRDPELASQYTWDRPNPEEILRDHDFPRSKLGCQKRMRDISGYDRYKSKEVGRVLNFIW